MDYLVSIIVPIYNVESYISECIKSILKQTYKSFELILINDGSSDNSLNICREYEAKDDRIKIINKKNEGVSISRNLGISLAKGRYILFVDSDDYVNEDWCYELVNSIRQNEENFVMSGYNIKNIRGKSEELILKNYENTDKSRLYMKDFYETYSENLLNYVWNKIYITDVLKNNNIGFNNEICLGEDLLFNLAYMKFIKGDIIVINKPTYNYVLRDRESLDNKYYENLFDIYVLLYSELYKSFKIFNSDLDKYEKKYYISYYAALSRALINTFSSKCKLSRAEKYRENTKIFRSNEFRKCVKYLGANHFNTIHYIILLTKNYYLELLYSKIKQVLV